MLDTIIINALPDKGMLDIAQDSIFPIIPVLIGGLLSFYGSYWMMKKKKDEENIEKKKTAIKLMCFLAEEANNLNTEIILFRNKDESKKMEVVARASAFQRAINDSLFTIVSNVTKEEIVLLKNIIQFSAPTNKDFFIRNNDELMQNIDDFLKKNSSLL